jgi:hypothetical protein
MDPRQVHSTITGPIEQETLSRRPHVPDFIDTPLVNEPSTVQQSSDGWAVDLRACQLACARRSDTPAQFRVKAECAEVERTSIFSLRENAIAQEPAFSYPQSWRCASRLGALIGGAGSFELFPQRTLSRGAFSAPSLVTPTR